MDPNAPQPPVAITPSPIVPVQPAQSNGRKRLIFIIGICTVLIIGILVAFLVVTQKKEVPRENIIPTPTIRQPFLQEVTLLKGDVVKVPDADIALQYTNSINPSKDCPECSSSTEIKITQGKNEEILIYSCGGIVGACIDSQEKFGYKVSILERTNDTKLKVRIAKL